MEWTAKWRESVVPLRLKPGLGIGGAWLDHERSRFVCWPSRDAETAVWLSGVQATETKGRALAPVLRALWEWGSTSYYAVWQASAPRKPFQTKAVRQW